MTLPPPLGPLGYFNSHLRGHWNLSCSRALSLQLGVLPSPRKRNSTSNEYVNFTEVQKSLSSIFAPPRDVIIRFHFLTKMRVADKNEIEVCPSALIFEWSFSRGLFLHLIGPFKGLMTALRRDREGQRTFKNSSIDFSLGLF